MNPDPGSSIFTQLVHFPCYFGDMHVAPLVLNKDKKKCRFIHTLHHQNFVQEDLDPDPHSIGSLDPHPH